MKRIQTKIFFICFLLIQFSVSGQSKKNVTGTVLDVNGMPLAGATVLIKGGDVTAGVSSDFDGKFTIQASNSDVLLISYVGYLVQEVSVSNKSTLSIVLQEDTSLLNEVVVVGYGSQKKATITDAVSTVKMESILGDRPITNAIAALQGVVPGMQITSNSGEPGSQGLGIQIRGFPSINGGEALILQDNVPVRFSDVNPQDIETVTVLKDASASAIYGARAAFGVILITTKKAEKGQEIRLNYSSTTSISQPENLPEKASTYEFVNALNDFGQRNYWTGQVIPTWVGFLEGYKNNPSAYPNGIAQDNNGLEYPLRDTDALGLFLDNQGLTQIHNLNISGGSEKTSFRISAGHINEDGIIVTDNDRFKKITLNAYLQTDLTSNLSSTTRIAYLKSDKNSPNGNFGRAVGFTPFSFEGIHEFEDGREPLPYLTPRNEEVYEVPKNTLVDNIRLFQKMVYSPFKDFNLTGEYTFEKRNRDIYDIDAQQEYVHPQTFGLFGGDPLLTNYFKSNTKTVKNSLNVYADYKKSVGNHNFKGTVGLNREESDAEKFTIKKTNLISTDLPSISGATGDLTGKDEYFNWALMGYFGRFTYDFKEKYLLKVSGRYDGSSRFREGDRFGFFPSFSAGWVVSKEGFMKNISFLNQLKFRASYGEIGNQNVQKLAPDGRSLIDDFYPYLALMDPFNVNWLNEASGARYVSLGAPNLVSKGFTWENVESKGLGMDLQMFNNRLAMTFDVFERNTIGMIAPGAQLPAVLGVNAPQQNAADLQTRGWEFEMTWRDRIKDFSYNIGFNLWDSQSEITKFLNEGSLIGNEGALIRNHYVGEKIGEIWGYETDGFYTVDDFEPGSLSTTLEEGVLKEGVVSIDEVRVNPGDIKYKDLNGDGVINDGNNTLITEFDQNGNAIPKTGPGDRKIIGNSSRRYQFGINGGASYKSFDFSFVLNGVGKREVWQESPVIFPFTDQFGIAYKHQLDYWTPDNTNAFFPRIYENGNYAKSRRIQTKYLLDGSYLRIKNITLGYSLPKSVLDKIKINNLRLFISGENLFNFDNLPNGISTELKNIEGGGNYPFLKSYNFGVNVSL